MVDIARLIEQAQKATTTGELDLIRQSIASIQNNELSESAKASIAAGLLWVQMALEEAAKRIDQQQTAQQGSASMGAMSAQAYNNELQTRLGDKLTAEDKKFLDTIDPNDHKLRGAYLKTKAGMLSDKERSERGIEMPEPDELRDSTKQLNEEAKKRLGQQKQNAPQNNKLIEQEANLSSAFQDVNAKIDAMEKSNTSEARSALQDSLKSFLPMVRDAGGDSSRSRYPTQNEPDLQNTNFDHGSGMPGGGRGAVNHR